MVVFIGLMPCGLKEKPISNNGRTGDAMNNAVLNGAVETLRGVLAGVEAELTRLDAGALGAHIKAAETQLNALRLTQKEVADQLVTAQAEVASVQGRAEEAKRYAADILANAEREARAIRVAAEKEAAGIKEKAAFED
jgi:hypothetical protein